ncbi:inactive phospholipase C-like protein 1 [Brevipalpus obovatus]|uniref:inactive phospholipase C-like protein 1 n=1 Tax=Brevipalpus obovatus TaxID=246614 RepID=UPI003D9E81BE
MDTEWKETNSSESEEGVFAFGRTASNSNTDSSTRQPKPSLTSTKSVCFHSISCNPGADRKAASPLDCLQIMMSGCPLVKIKANTRQYRRFYSLTEDLTAIVWVPSSKKSSKARYCIKDIREVRSGKNTEVMRNKENSLLTSEECVFSIIHGDDFDTLDLVAPCPEDANIWVTGLNFLIGANKSSGQKMREKWLQDSFDEADSTGREFLDESETVALMKQLQSSICVDRLKQKILEHNLGKESEERGRITKQNFVTLYYETATRPDIYFILVRYCGKDYMTVEDLQLFLEGEQGICGISLDECAHLIDKLEPSPDGRENKQLLIDGFTQLLVSQELQLANLTRDLVYQDMNQPLSHYFIATSHNTYLLEDQLKGPSSPEGYERALLQGARCVKIDVWDSPNGPVVFHGNTLTSKSNFTDILHTIKKNAFIKSEYPLIIHLENHCSVDFQRKLAHQMREILGSDLFKPSESLIEKSFKTADQEQQLYYPLLSPHQLKHKILINGKKLKSSEEDVGQVSDEDEAMDLRFNPESVTKKQLCRELSEMVYLHRIRCYDFAHVLKSQQLDQVCYLDEASASKLALASPEDLVHHNKTFLTQVVPDPGRIDSTNFTPSDFWNCGCQMVSMNYQSSGQMMDMYRGWFQQNGGSGYVLKPTFLRERFCLFNARRKDSLPGIDPLCLRIKIISGQQLPRPKGASCKAVAIDPYVTVELFGVPSDCAESRTRTISNEANNPIFDESFEFSVSVPELAMLRLVVLDDEYINDDFIGQSTILVECIQQGYRHIKMYSYDGELIPDAFLFVHLSLTHRYGSKQKLRRKRSWTSKNWTDLRTVGIKQIDETFKSASSLLQQSIQMRKEVEKLMLDLCDECNLQENANVAQCLRILTLRLASSISISSFNIVLKESGLPMVRVGGEMTPKLQKSIQVLERTLSEFKILPPNASSLLELMGENHDQIIKLGMDLNQLTTGAGMKGRKAEKAIENFMWNLSLIKTEMGTLAAVKDDSECSLKQVERLTTALQRIFERERRASFESNQSQKILVPEVIQPSTLEVKLPPPTPTSPGDARLRGILKKPVNSSSANSPTPQRAEIAQDNPSSLTPSPSMTSPPSPISPNNLDQNGNSHDAQKKPLESTDSSDLIPSTTV